MPLPPEENFQSYKPLTVSDGWFTVLMAVHARNVDWLYEAAKDLHDGKKYTRG